MNTPMNLAAWGVAAAVVYYVWIKYEGSKDGWKGDGQECGYAFSLCLIVLLLSIFVFPGRSKKSKQRLSGGHRYGVFLPLAICRRRAGLSNRLCSNKDDV